MSTESKLVRAMTRVDLTALAINGIIGSGIFGLPAIIARLLGVSSPIAFVVCAIIVYVFVLCFAEVASHFSDTGGPYLYARTIFGPFIGFEVGWSVWLARVSAFAANSNVFILYLGFFAPQMTTGIARGVVIVAIAAALSVVNIRGVQSGARVGDIFAGAKVAVLGLFGLAGLFFVDWSRFAGFGLPNKANFGAAVLLLVYAFTGFEYAVIPAAEAKNPRKDIAWALITALGVCATIYIAVQVVALGTVPNLPAAQRPLADSAQNFLGSIGAGVISLLVLVSVIGNLSALILVSPRLTYAFSERRDFPDFFGKLHSEYRTPAISIVFYAAIGSILAIAGNFQQLATVSVVARLANYIVTCAAVPILRKRSDSEHYFRVPFGPVIPIIGIALAIWLLFQATRTDILGFLVASAVGAVLYLARPRKS